MKDEMIFGVSKFFDGAPNDAEFAAKEDGYGIRFYKNVVANTSYEYFSSGKWIESIGNPRNTFKAMRRIIKEPKRWTMADKISGETPNVGDILMLGGLTVEFIGIDLIDDYEWHVKHQSGRCESANFKYFYTVETPEEKADRLRSEWINKAYVDFHRLGCELEVLQKEQIKQIYDAILSGELTMPGKVDE